MYQIKKYSYDQAKKLGLKISPSNKGKYKIDIFYASGIKKGDYITSIGNIFYSDYPTYLETHDKEYAEKRRKLYHLRHRNDASKIRGFLALNILW